MPMYNPSHPGGLAWRVCIEPMGLPVARVAKGLGVSERELQDLLDEKASVSVDMAIRLSKAFGSTPKVWLGMQTAYDLWQARDDPERFAVEDFSVAEDATPEPVASG